MNILLKLGIDKYIVPSIYNQLDPLTSVLLFRSLGINRPLCKNAIYNATATGNLALVILALDEGGDTTKICLYATDHGKLNVLQWARKNNYPWSEYISANAAALGHLEIFKWAHENGCPWSERACAFASYHGHFELLKWARENGCPWNAFTCLYAALNGYLDILKWALKNGCPCNINELIKTATKSKLLHILQWLRENGYHE